jgi:hypothetical protein
LNVLEIPAAQPALTPMGGAFTPTNGGGGHDLDAVLDRVMHQESGGNPLARGAKGELGLFQLMPSTAALYGVRDPNQLFNPQVNRSVAKQYLGDLLKHYNGNMQLALAAYNAGPGRVDKGLIPTSTHGYVQRIMSALGPASASAAEPSEYTGPSVPHAASVKTPSSPTSGAAGEPTEYTGPTVPHGATATMPSAPAAPTPWPVKAAAWLPTAGQFGGEILGGLGGTIVPGLGETGASEYAGVVGGGALGSAGGAVLENQIRAAYGLPPVSVGKEALLGGGTSLLGVGGRFLTGVARARRAGQVATQAEKAASEAFGQATGRETGIERTLGMGERKAGLLANAPAQSARGAYLETREAGLRQLGQEYDKVLKPYAGMRIANPAMRTTLNGPTGKMLEIAGKPLRTALEDEINREPLTVRKARIILTTIRRYKAAFNPERDRMALSALSNLENAVKLDIKRTVGPAAAQQLDTLDIYYARKIAQYPVRAVRMAFTEPQAAAAILASKPGDVGRVVGVVDDMMAQGKGETLRRAVSALMWQKAGVGAATNPAERLEGIAKAVSSIDKNVFDKLYGTGARDQWLRSTRAVLDRNAEWLKHPNEAAAVKAAVQAYLKQPGVLARIGGRALEHRLIIGGMMTAGGYEFGHGELMAAGGGLFLLNLYEYFMHTQKGMRLLEQAALAKSPQMTARYIIAGLDASLHGLLDDSAQQANGS